MVAHKNRAARAREEFEARHTKEMKDWRAAKGVKAVVIRSASADARLGRILADAGLGWGERRKVVARLRGRQTVQITTEHQSQMARLIANLKEGKCEIELVRGQKDERQTKAPPVDPSTRPSVRQRSPAGSQSLEVEGFGRVVVRPLLKREWDRLKHQYGSDPDRRIAEIIRLGVSDPEFMELAKLEGNDDGIDLIANTIIDLTKRNIL